MKVQIVLPLSIIVSVALLGFLKVLKKEELTQNKRSRFQEIKVRVSADVLGEYLKEKVDTELRLGKAEEEQKTLEEQVNALKANEEKAKGDVDICTAEMKSETDQLAAVEAEVNMLKGEFEKENNSWKTEHEALKQELEKRSPVCNYLNRESGAMRTLCGAEAQKKEDPKAEEPKKEEPKAQEPKKEEPKAEAPKQEEPKKEEPKAEEPKKEEPKAEEPKKEEPKAEEPKKEEPKAEEPKKEEPKAEEPKQEEKKAEEPKKE
uniref:Zgc:174935 n=1 Tax=Amphiprion percula TaxID=161767 RepID=A0A3P8RXM2_AMPPE